MVMRHRLLFPTLLLWAAIASGAAGPEDEEDNSRPTVQPPTRGQDFQKCAWFALPEVINLAPVSSNWFYRTGKWSGKMGAELVNWEQCRFRIDYTNIDYYVDMKPWFHAKVLRNPELELRKMNIWLPAPRHSKNAWDDKPAKTVVYVDCESTPMYISREFERGYYEVFNHIGQLVATGAPAKLVPGQLYFSDDRGVPFAIAGSPTISEVATGWKQWLPQYHLYDFDHWQLWYMAGFNSVSYLKDPEHRWIIAAVVQEHAILDTLIKGGSGETSTPVQYIAFLTMTVLTCLGIVFMSCCGCYQIFFMVYPPKKVVKGNPFMVEDIGGHPYGSFALTHQRPAP